MDDDATESRVRRGGEGGSPWSIRIGALAGIPIRIHLTFFLLLLWFGNVSAGQGEGFLGGVVFMLLLFGCVVLHELGHALAARRWGVATREIVLYPFGGVARIDRMPSGKAELVIALAGPAVNLVLAAMLGAVLFALRAHAPGSAEELIADAPVLWQLLWSNLVLFGFNLLPAFPMDGGRVLRALLAFRFGWLKGTRWAAAVGQGLAVAGGVWALLSGQILLALLAAFVYFGAGQERTHAEARHVLESLRLADAYNRHALVLAPGDRLSRVVHYLLTSYQPDFAVIDRAGVFAGVVTRERALAIAATRADDPFVLDFLETRVPRLETHLTLAEAQEALADSGTTCGAVVEQGRFLGLVSQQDLAEAIGIAAALGAGRGDAEARSAA